MDQKTVYTADSSLRRPRELFRRMLEDLAGARELAWRLLIRNISARYRQTLFGYVWAFLPAAATTLLWVFLRAQNIFGVGDTKIPYALYVLTGTLLWQGFVDALNAPIRLAVESKDMLRKIKIPYEALLLTAWGEVLFNFLIRLVLLAGAYIWFGVAVPATALLAVPGIAVLLGLGMVFGTLLVPLGLLYEDISRGLLVLTPLWFFVTPVVYPAPTGGFPASLIATVNPVSPVLMACRDWLTLGASQYNTGFCVVAGLTAAGAGVTWLGYRLAMPYLIERMGS